MLVRYSEFINSLVATRVCSGAFIRNVDGEHALPSLNHLRFGNGTLMPANEWNFLAVVPTRSFCALRCLSQARQVMDKSVTNVTPVPACSRLAEGRDDRPRSR
jgi:hypothetical protein